MRKEKISKVLLFALIAFFIVGTSTAQKVQSFVLKASYGTSFPQTIGFYFKDGLTDGYEGSYDSYSFQVSNSFGLFIPWNGDEWTTLGVAPVAEKRSFPISLNTDADRMVNWNVSVFENFGSREKVYLVDSTTNNAYPLTSGQEFSFNVYAKTGLDRFYLYVENTPLITWNGTSWSNSSGPSETDNVDFTGDYTMSEDVGRTVLSCKDFKVSEGVKVTIDNEGTLDIKGDLENSGNLTIVSGASFLTYDGMTFTGNDIEIYRNTHYGNGRYSYVGTPVEERLGNIGSDLGTFVYQYNEQKPYGDNEGLLRWEDALNDKLILGRGYAQAGQKELVFSGSPNNGTIIFTGTYTQDVNIEYEGWNLVANPYPASIGLSDFLTQNTNIAGAVYLWDDNGSDQERGTNNDYVVANEAGATNTTPAGGATRFNGYIGSAQGFFVKLLDQVDKDITFTEAMRSVGNNDDQHFFRRVENIERLRLNLTNEKGLFKQTLIARTNEVEDAQLNRLYDARVFDVNQPNAVYSIKLDNDLAIQTISHSVSHLPIGVNIEESGLYTLSVEDIEFKGEVYLIDKEKGKTFLLSDAEYSFYSYSGKIKDRFMLDLSRDILSADLIKPFEIYVYDNVLHFQISGISTREHFRIISITGQIVKNFTIRESTDVNLTGLKPGVYMLVAEQNSLKFIVR